jgi:hypothetical protein
MIRSFAVNGSVGGINRSLRDARCLFTLLLSSAALFHRLFTLELLERLARLLLRHLIALIGRRQLRVDPGVGRVRLDPTRGAELAHEELPRLDVEESLGV